MTLPRSHAVVATRWRCQPTGGQNSAFPWHPAGEIRLDRRPYHWSCPGNRTRAGSSSTDASVQDTFPNAPEDPEEADPRVRQMRVEALLLLSKTPVSPRKLSQLAQLADATEARTLVRQLNRVYETHGRSIRIENVAGGYRMLTRPALAPWLAKLGHLPPAIRLSTPMMETLAVVAYRQPVSRASAEAIRGVACGELLRQLMERDLIRIAGRSEELGRPYLYGTTKRFLQLFGLPNAEALPPIDWQTLRDDDPSDSTPDDLSTSTKEPVVSNPAAPVLSDSDFSTSDSETMGQSETMGSQTREFTHADVDPILANAADESNATVAVIEDEEDDLYEATNDDDDDDDWDDDDDDWDDDDDDEEDDDDDDDDDDDEEEDDDDDDDEDDDDLDEDDKDLDDDWKEVDDEEDDDDDEDDEEWDDDDEEEDAAEDDEEWD